MQKVMRCHNFLLISTFNYVCVKICAVDMSKTINQKLLLETIL